MSFLEYALSKARQITYVRGQSRHYSVLLDKKNRIISEGQNSYQKTHTTMHKASRKVGLEKDYLHCEVAALIKDKDRKGSKLIVVRVDSKGQAVNSEPCPVCKEVLRSFPNVKSIEFSV